MCWPEEESSYIRSDKILDTEDNRCCLAVYSAESRVPGYNKDMLSCIPPGAGSTAAMARDYVQ